MGKYKDKGKKSLSYYVGKQRSINMLLILIFSGILFLGLLGSYFGFDITSIFIWLLFFLSFGFSVSCSLKYNKIWKQITITSLVFIVPGFLIYFIDINAFDYVIDHYLFFILSWFLFLFLNSSRLIYKDRNNEINSIKKEQNIDIIKNNITGNKEESDNYIGRVFKLLLVLIITVPLVYSSLQKEEENTIKISSCDKLATGIENNGELGNCNLMITDNKEGENLVGDAPVINLFSLIRMTVESGDVLLDFWMKNSDIKEIENIKNYKYLQKYITFLLFYFIIIMLFLSYYYYHRLLFSEWENQLRDIDSKNNKKQIITCICKKK